MGYFYLIFLVNFVMTDDDSEPILGQWFEETLSPSESQGADVPSPSSATGANDANGGSGKHAHHHGSTDSTLSADKKEPDTVCTTAWLAASLLTRA